MRYISLWVAKSSSPEELSPHLGTLYRSIGPSNFASEPRVCEELELVPIAELIEPFLLSESAAETAVATAEQQSLGLATTVVAVYTHRPPDRAVLQPSGCALKFIGTFCKEI